MWDHQVDADVWHEIRTRMVRLDMLLAAQGIYMGKFVLGMLSPHLTERQRLRVVLFI